MHAADGFVAVRDIAPAAETHLLVLPERHVDTFRDVGAFPDEEAGRMLRFVAEVAAAEGLDDYRVWWRTESFVDATHSPATLPASLPATMPASFAGALR